MFTQKENGRQWRIQKGKESRKISSGLQSRGGTALEWVSGDQVRIPQEKVKTFQRGLPFLAGGRPYAGIGLITVGKPPADGWTRDAYGRQVYCYRERFPCFDSYDYLNEKRYYRWFLIYQDGRLTRIYAEDERPAIYVTEDVAFLEDKLWEQLESSGFFEQK